MVAPNPTGPAAVRPTELIPLQDAPDYLPRRAGGRKVHWRSVYRWARRGMNGVRLRTVRPGGRSCTTEQWLMDFAVAAKLAVEPEDAPPVAPPSVAQTFGQAQRELSRMERELIEQGA